MDPCLFCGATDGDPTDEHVVPQWARRPFSIQGPVTVLRSDRPRSEEKLLVGRMQALNLVLRHELCAPCNNDWLAGIERAVKPILEPMAVSAKPTTLGPKAQALLALWATKTVLMLERALRQIYPDRRPIRGYIASAQEFAWIRANNEPPPRSLVWLGCWDCRQETPLMYEPSAAGLPTADGAVVTGHLTTFALGFVAFQVFTVDFIAAEQHRADVWNTRPPAVLAPALLRIWPHLLGVRSISWPPAAFANDDWHRLVTWDEVLRPSEKVSC